MYLNYDILHGSYYNIDLSLNIPILEESFDLIEDIFDELDTEALTQFG